MKKIKKKTKAILACLFVASCITLVGCGNADTPVSASVEQEENAIPSTTTMITYTDKKGSFSIQYSDQWQQEETLDEQAIVLENSELNASIKIQRYNKDVLALQNISNMDNFITLHHQASIGALLALAQEQIDIPIELSNVNAAKAQQFSYVQDSVTRKCYLAYLETDNAYYSCLISAPQQSYDKFIQTWSMVNSTLTELADPAQPLDASEEQSTNSTQETENPDAAAPEQDQQNTPAQQ